MNTARTTVPESAGEGYADPVKALMHRHRELCERAVDPLEIAAGLEAHGVTDRTAARFRHRDVFSLAEELYARVPHGTEWESSGEAAAVGHSACATDPRARRAHLALHALLPLLPGTVCALAVIGTEATEGAVRLAAGSVGGLAVAAALAVCLRYGSLRAVERTAPAVRLWTWTLWLLAYTAYTAYGAGLPAHLAAPGRPLVGLAFAVAPAVWCARLFAVRARRGLDSSRGLAEFASGARPLLLGVVALYVSALAALLVVTDLVLPHGALVPVTALGTLLFLARLLIVHGFPRSASAGLATACAIEAAALALQPAARLLPGYGFLARPVEAVTGAWGAGAVPALACGAAALGLLAHATAALSRASAHVH
ncbi:hypothetical protein ACIHCQ_06140 [Streptomyces sp. NPDC052236]|uniref:hypothetical protein n=1 Tax=Streptomyces sp. NPDC052236 TaxID=3365686 RepID=UPI0037D6CECE